MSGKAADFSGKIVLVTGASRGLGYASALAFAKAGAHVLALARTVGGLEELDDEIGAAGGTCSLIPCDLSDFDMVDAIGGSLAQRFDRLDGLILNAGVLGELAPIGDIDPKVFRRAFDVNVEANWRLIRSVEPLLRASAAGRIVAVTSRVALTPRAFWTTYAASKAAFEMMMKIYAEEMKITNVRVAIVDPGAMRTKMRAQAMPGEDPGVNPDPEVVAPLVLDAASADYDGVAERFVQRDRVTSK